MQATSAKQIYDKKYDEYKLSGVWGDALGAPETNGVWLIWGREKHGKSTVALMLAEYLSKIATTLYVSAEEGTRKTFRDAMKRAGVAHDTSLKIISYISLLELDAKLEKRRAPRVVFIDNVTVYHEELKYGFFHTLIKKHADVIFVFLAHEEKKEPYTSSAKLISRFADIRIHVEGLTAFVSGRCPGGTLTIDENKSALYWGNSIKPENA